MLPLLIEGSADPDCRNFVIEFRNFAQHLDSVLGHGLYFHRLPYELSQFQGFQYFLCADFQVIALCPDLLTLGWQIQVSSQHPHLDV